MAYLALHDGTIFGYADPDMFSRHFNDCAGYRGVGCDSWLLFHEDDEGLGLLRLMSPFTGWTKLLPSLLGIRTRHEPIEIDRALRVRRPVLWRDDMGAMAVQKLVERPDGAIAALVGSDSLSKVALCSLESFTWSFSAHDQWRRYQDLAVCGGRLHALTIGADLLAFDVRVDAATGEAAISRVKRVISSPPATPLNGDVLVHCLVTSSRPGELLMVRRLFPANRNKVQRFAVFRADLGLTSSQTQWVELSSLDGDVLFVGRQCSQAVTPKPPIRGDQIFILQDEWLRMSIWADHGWSRPSPSQCHTSVYDMRFETVTFLQPREQSRDGPAPPTWIFPDANVLG